MIRIILHGCSGRMGHIITGICEGDFDTQIVAGVDVFGSAYADYPVYRSLEECPEADVIIDFSTAAAIDELLSYAAARKIPVVVCTTGLSEEQTKDGINLLEVLIAQAAPKLAAAGFDIEIVEKHHRTKIDAPSGTAIALADAANEALGGDYEYVYDRSVRRETRPVKEIGLSAVRGGTIVGDHDVIFAGQDEVITLSHRAYSRAVFGKGAVEAAKFLAGKEAGFYTMGDVLS